MKKLGVTEEEGDSTDDMLLNYFMLVSLDHLGVDKRVISLPIESNIPRACFGRRRQREREM